MTRRSLFKGLLASPLAFLFGEKTATPTPTKIPNKQGFTDIYTCHWETVELPTKEDLKKIIDLVQARIKENNR